MTNPCFISVSSVALFAVSILWALGIGLVIGYLRGRAHGVQSQYRKPLPGSSLDDDNSVTSHTDQ